MNSMSSKQRSALAIAVLTSFLGSFLISGVNIAYHRSKTSCKEAQVGETQSPSHRRWRRWVVYLSFDVEGPQTRFFRSPFTRATIYLPFQTSQHRKDTVAHFRLFF